MPKHGNASIAYRAGMARWAHWAHWARRARMRGYAVMARPASPNPDATVSDTADKIIRCDVAIAGAGAAGMATALALAHADAGLRVVIVAKLSPAGGVPGKPVDPPAGARAYAVAGASRRLLARLGVWKSVEAHAQPMQRIIVTDGKPGGTQLSLLDLATGEDPGDTAMIVEEPALLAGLAQRVARTDAIDSLADQEIVDYQVSGSGAVLTTKAGIQIACRLAIGADGGGSPMRRLAGLRTVAWDYGQSGLVATVTHAGEHHGVGVERFLPAGPFAILPLRGNRSSLVWTEATPVAQRLVKACADDFLAALTPRFGTERGDILEVGPRAAFPLKFMLARSFIAPRLALVGDAAHSVHPLAGLGLNLGLRDVAALAETVAEAARLGLDIGTSQVLERYQRWRRFDTVMLGFAFDGLNALFSNNSESLAIIRDLGMGAVQQVPFLKRLFAREAAGRAGTLPRLLAGKAI